MTVKEMIEKLQGMNPEAVVVSGDCFSMPFENSIITTTVMDIEEFYNKDYVRIMSTKYLILKEQFK